MPIFNPDTADPTIYNIYLDNLADVYAANPLDGYIIQWSDASGAWLAVSFASITGAPNSLDALTNVTIASESAGQVLAYNGSIWINSGIGVDSLMDAQAASPTGLNVLAYTGGTWTNMPLRLEHLANVLKSGEHGYPIDQDVLHYHGGYWQSGPLALDHLTDVNTAGASIGKVLLYNGTYWSPQEASAETLNLDGIFAPTGLVNDGVTTNQTILQNALNAGGLVYLPTGTYYISSLLNMIRSNTKLFGPGTIKGASNFAGSQLIYIGGSGCTVEGITLDGSEVLDPDVIGINMNGIDALALNVTITGTTDHGINMPSRYATVDRCKLFHCARSGGDAIDAVGLISRIQNTYIYGYGTKGIGGDCAVRTPTDDSYLYIDNCYIVAKTGVYQTRRPTVFGEPILIDSGPTFSGYNAVYIKNTVIDYLDFQSGTSTQLIKLAKADSVYIDGCNFMTSTTGDEITCGLRVAEGVGQINITNSTITPNVFYETYSGDEVSDTFVAENCRIGNFAAPYWRSKIPFEDLRAKYIKINNCSIHASGTTRMIRTEWDGVQKIDVTNNRIIGHHTASIGAIATTTGTLGLERYSRKLYWHNNYIANSGSSTIVLGTNNAELFLSETRNSEASWYSANSPTNPTGLSQFNRITFQQNDRITNTGTISVGTAVDWICTVGGKPGTWMQLNAASGGTTTSLATLTDVSLSNRTDNQGLIYIPSKNAFVNTDIVFGPTGLVPGTGANNTVAINNLLDSVGYCYIPSGDWYINTHIRLNKNNSKLFGPGTLVGSVGFVNDQMIYIPASSCVIEDITINGTNCPANVGGVNLAGDNNTLRNAKISRTKYHGVLMPGEKSHVDDCYFYQCGLSGAVPIKANGRINYVTNTTVDGWMGKGIVADHQKSLGAYSAFYVDNCYFRTNTMVLAVSGIESCLLVDVGEGNPSYNLVAITNSAFHFEQIGTGIETEFNTNVLKLATTDNAKIDNCSIISYVTGANLVDGLHIAEKVLNITIENSVISPNIGYEDATSRISDSIVVRNCQIGGVNPRHKGYRSLYQLRARHIHIDNCYLESTGSNIAIYTDYDDIQKLKVENSRIHGNYDSNFIGLTWNTGTQEYYSRRISFEKTSITNSGAGAIFTAGNPALRLLYTATNDAASSFTANCPTNPTGLSQINLITFQKGDKIVNTGTLTPGAISEWVCTTAGKPGTWTPVSQFFAEGQGLSNLHQSYLTGIYDVTYYGVTNTGANVTIPLQTFLTNVPNRATVRIPGGTYLIDDTIIISGKYDVNFDVSPGARFIETRRLPSGMFLMHYSSGINWQGGFISGADTLSFILGFASGIEFSGLGIEHYGPGADIDESDRFVLGQAFTTNFCGNMVFKNIKIVNKFRAFNDYFGFNLHLDNIRHYGVHRGQLNRLDTTIVFGATGGFPNTGSASAQIGDIYKETARSTYSFTLGKTKLSTLVNCYSSDCGGLLNVGTPSLGGGGGIYTENLNIINCFSHNPYDNGIYVGSAHKVLVDGTRVITDRNLLAMTSAIKGRGSHIVFNNCYVEFCFNGYGIEGFGNTADYWTLGGSDGWSSEGCRITNCTAVDCSSNGVFTDNNQSIYPRDLLIANNYFYNCALGPYGNFPTGYFAGVEQIGTVPISVTDCRRVRIINNTIENTGNIGPDYAMTVGANTIGSIWITGAEIMGNKLLGVKNGIYVKNLANARIADNWGERIGQYNSIPFIGSSGFPSMVITNGLKDSRIHDNMLAPTGHCASVYVLPGSTFTNVIRRDNDGYEVIN